MPSTVTHAFFSTDVYEILPSNIRNKFDIDRIKTFAQSIDACKFYNVVSIFKGKYIRDFSGDFHGKKTQEFFINLLKYVKDNNIDDIDTYSFIFGFICHYVSDSTMHPFIIYKTGIFDKNNKNTYKYNNLHHFMETYIDNDMIHRRLGINPYSFNISKYVFDNRKFSSDLNKTIDNVFYNVYGVKNMSKIYYKSLKQMESFIRLFRQDRFGIKRVIYKTIDSFTTKRTFRLEAISYHYPLIDKHNYLNSNNKLWRNPTTYNMTSTESFIDLYLKAIKKTKVLVCASLNI